MFLFGKRVILALRTLGAPSLETYSVHFSACCFWRVEETEESERNIREKTPPRQKPSDRDWSGDPGGKKQSSSTHYATELPLK